MKNAKLKRLLISFFIIGLLITQSTVGTFAVSKTITLTFNKQEQTNWCWAATSQSIIKYITGRYPSQTDIVINIKGSAKNEGATLAENSQSLAAWGVGNTAITSSIAMATVKSQIDTSKPFKIGINWASGGGHNLLVYGYYDNSSNTDPQVYFLDPWPDNPTVNLVKYSYLVSNSSYSWGRTFYQVYKTY